jgi:hypothetical protein
MPVYYDLSWFDIDGMDINGRFSREYQLEKVFPKLSAARLGDETTAMYRRYFNLYPGTRRDYEEGVFSSREARYLGGYYLNAGYIESQGDSLRDEFTFDVSLSERNREIESLIMSVPHSAAVHIRRGDYVGSVHDVTGPKYFTEAVKFISKKLSPEHAVFFIFSNGMDWSRKALGGLDERLVFVENNDNGRGEIDMYLMSRCSHFIISNSSFSWWPAWLSKRSSEKIVVMPDRWFSGESVTNRCTMSCDGWAALGAR